MEAGSPSQPRSVGVHVQAFGNTEGVRQIEGRIHTKPDGITFRHREPAVHRVPWGTAEDRTDLLIRDMYAGGMAVVA